MKYLWGVRHVRYFCKSIAFNWWWITTGHYLGAFPSVRDLEHLDDVWNGFA